jgi:hypothetical protein
VLLYLGSLCRVLVVIIISDIMPSVNMINVIMISDITLSVIMLGVVMMRREHLLKGKAQYT